MTDDPGREAFPHPDFDVEKVIENRDFYVVRTKGNFRKKSNFKSEIDRLLSGIHLLRCEHYRLRATAARVNRDVIERELPDYVPPIVYERFEEENHWMSSNETSGKKCSSMISEKRIWT